MVMQIVLLSPILPLHAFWFDRTVLNLENKFFQLLLLAHKYTHLFTGTASSECPLLILSLPQDLGNLNCTVFTHRHDYSRPRNLRLVCEALNERWDTRLHVNQRDDIICNNRWKVSPLTSLVSSYHQLVCEVKCYESSFVSIPQVSGTSAKLARDSAYHHFTLLLNVDTSNLHQLLRPHSEVSLLPSNKNREVA